MVRRQGYLPLLVVAEGPVRSLRDLAVAGASGDELSGTAYAREIRASPPNPDHIPYLFRQTVRAGASGGAVTANASPIAPRRPDPVA